MTSLLVLVITPLERDASYRKAARNFQWSSFFCRTYNSDGEVNRFKAVIVFKGFWQGSMSKKTMHRWLNSRCFAFFCVLVSINGISCARYMRVPLPCRVKRTLRFTWSPPLALVFLMVTRCCNWGNESMFSSELRFCGKRRGVLS